MSDLKYKVIKSATQYEKYCDLLEELLGRKTTSKVLREEVELLSLLIEKYDEENGSDINADPVELLKSLMKEHQMRAVELAALLGVSQGLVSDILHYKKGISKSTIRILSERFKLSQEAFNRPYLLNNISGSGQTRSGQKVTRQKRSRTLVS